MTKTYILRELTRDEWIALIDQRIDEAAQLWKDYVRENEFGFADFKSRLNSQSPIIRPSQR
jgi:hypothetical protein